MRGRSPVLKRRPGRFVFLRDKYHQDIINSYQVESYQDNVKNLNLLD
jgi:hypothetical protein